MTHYFVRLASINLFGLCLLACGGGMSETVAPPFDAAPLDTVTPPPPPPPPPPPTDFGTDIGVAPDLSPPPDSAPSDAASDAGPLDAQPDVGSPDGPQPDVTTKPLVAVGPGPFKYTAPGPLDLNTLVNGGATPLKCKFYSGDGDGTVPPGATLSNCSLTGGFQADNPPGLYGFIVTVTDAQGSTVELPITARNGNCNTNVVTITPAEFPVRTSAPGEGYSWTWQIKDLDAVCSDATCATCPTCVKYAIGTKLPLKLTTFADCAQPGDICIANSTTQKPPSCPSVVSWQGEIRVKPHTPPRANKPAWVTIASDVAYSGTKVGSACGDKQWACHIEVLETN